MDLMESLRILRRRWILTSTLLLLTLAATGAAAYSWPRTYVANATTVLLAPKNFAKPAGGNPYLVFDSSLTDTADVVRRQVGGPRVAETLAARGYTASYTVVPASDTTGPVLLITVTGKSKAVVESTLGAVTAEVGTVLTGLQVGAGIVPDNQIKDLVVSMSPTATRSLSKLARPLVVVLAFGLVLTFFIPQIVDGQATRRQRRRNAGAKLDDVSDPDELVSESRADNTYRRNGTPVHADLENEITILERPGYRLEPERSKRSAPKGLR